MSVGRGIAPETLRSQIEAACPWTLALETPAAAIARGAADVTPEWERDPTSPAYFRLLLTAHYLTVGSFCPTDVDVRIRAHQWTTADAERLDAAVELVDQVASFRATDVSARVLELPGAGPLSGHDGEWLAVRAGALGRALEVGRDDLAASLGEVISTELDREASILRAAAARVGDADGALDALRAVTIVAHNTGDLSRVVEAWPRGPRVEAVRPLYARLGHAAAPEAVARFGTIFARAGALNKSLMAVENHRFLALRNPRALRRSRELLLPIGPFFYGWGRTVAKCTHLEADDRAEVLAALLETHQRGAAQVGCLRAIAGLHDGCAGGVDALAPSLPARQRKLVFQGAVREAVRTSESAFTARFVARFRRELVLVGGLALVTLTTLVGCDRPENKPHSPVPAERAESGASSAHLAVSAASASSSTSAPPSVASSAFAAKSPLVQLLPPDGSDGAKVTVVEDRSDAVTAKVEKGGREVALLAINRVATDGGGPTPPVDRDTPRINGHPVVTVGKTRSTLLVGGRYEATVTSSTLDAAARRGWLVRFDVNGLTAR